MRHFLIAVLLLGFVGCQGSSTTDKKVEVERKLGAERFDEYLPLFKDKKVGIIANQTSTTQNGVHIVDSLFARKVNITKIFSPEHGFRGDADAGEKVGNSVDKKTGIEIISLYGKNRIPQDSIMKSLDIMVFDLQDVGVRFYTYISTMYELMQSCAKNNVEFMVFDRPNPLGREVYGPINDMKYKSFVGIIPIPLAHGMSVGELAKMINGENWLAKKDDKTGEAKTSCKLTVISYTGFSKEEWYQLPIAPSPNLKTMRSIYLYPSTCGFEGTTYSLGRGTENPFEMYGNPSYKKKDYSFTPKSLPGAKSPPQLDVLCYGVDLRTLPLESDIKNKLFTLDYIIDAYNNSSKQEQGKFFTPFFEKLMGTKSVREAIINGKTSEEIEKTWVKDIEDFKKKREKYLLY